MVSTDWTPARSPVAASSRLSKCSEVPCSLAALQSLRIAGVAPLLRFVARLLIRLAAGMLFTGERSPYPSTLAINQNGLHSASQANPARSAEPSLSRRRT